MQTVASWADPVRLRLLSLVASHADGEACVCDLSSTFDLSQTPISHHLKVLREAGLLECTKRGVWVFFRFEVTAENGAVGLIVEVPAERQDVLDALVVSTRSLALAARPPEER